MTSYWREPPPFDEAADYVVSKPGFWMDGKELPIGAPVPKERFAALPRRLFQFYDQGKIAMVPPKQETAGEALTSVSFISGAAAVMHPVAPSDELPAPKKRGRPRKIKA